MAKDAGPTPGALLWRTAMKWRAAVDRAVAPLGITHAQYSFLASLWSMTQKGLRPSQRQLAEHIGLEPLYVSKLARALDEAGLIRRTDDPSDSRAVQLTLTRSGHDVVRRAVKVVRDLQEQLTEPLGGVDAPRTRALVDALQTLLAVPDPRGANP